MTKAARSRKNEAKLPHPRKGIFLSLARSALLILSGNAFAAILLLARNLIVARLIPVEDYGVAATFAIAMAVVEMMSALGLQQQIVQSGRGDDPRFQAALQGFSLLRGVLAGAVLFALAGPLAAFLDIPQAAWAYQVLAVVPVLNAAAHFDVHRLNRQMRFWPLMLTGAVPALASLLLLWPLSLWFGDWRLMLWALLAQAGVGLVTSHLVAERRYALAFDPATMAASLRFGWPLLLNGALLFAVFNGEKLIVGREMGMVPLAILAMGVTLTLTPTLVLAKSAQNFFLPQLVAALPDPHRADRLALAILQAVGLAALTFGLAVMLIGGPLLHLLLGVRYEGLLPLIGWLGLQQVIRVQKAGPAIVALAQGRTGNALAANLLRVAVLPLVWWQATQGADLRVLIWTGIVGEGLGLIMSFALLSGSLRARSLRTLGLLAACLGMLALMLALLPTGAGAAPPVLWGMAGATLLAGVFFSPELQDYLKGRNRPAISEPPIDP